MDGRESLKAVPSWTSWRVKGVASTTRASPSHGGKAFVDSRESLKAVPSWTSRRSRIRSVKIVSGGSKCIRKGSPEGENRIRRVKVGPGRVVPEGQNRIRVAFGVSKSHPDGQSASGGPLRRVRVASGSSKSDPGRSFRRVKIASGRVKGVPRRVKIVSGGPESRSDGKQQKHRFSCGFPVVFHGFGRIRVVSERSKSYPKAISVKGGASKSHPEGQSASGEPFRRVKIASGSSKSCRGGSFGGSKWYPGGSKAYL